MQVINEIADPSLWKIIAASAGVTFIMRTLPSYFKKIKQLSNYPRVIKFLDYTTCMITGEVIYNATFNDVLKKDDFIPMMLISLMTLSLSGFLMYKTSKLAKSFLCGLVFFIVAILIIGL